MARTARTARCTRGTEVTHDLDRPRPALGYRNIGRSKSSSVSTERSTTTGT